MRLLPELLLPIDRFCQQAEPSTNGDILSRVTTVGSSALGELDDSCERFRDSSCRPCQRPFFWLPRGASSFCTIASSSGNESFKILTACCSCGVITSCCRNLRSCPSFTSRAFGFFVILATPNRPSLHYREFWTAEGRSRPGSLNVAQRVDFATAWCSFR